MTLQRGQGTTTTMPTNPRRFNPNPKRTTLSAPTDPRMDPRPQKAAEEEEKTRLALCDLRRKNTDLNEGIRKLEAAIGEPAFRRLMEQVTSAESSLAVSLEPSSSAAGGEDAEKQLIERYRKIVEPKLSTFFENITEKEDQISRRKWPTTDKKVCFASLNICDCRPKLFYAQWNKRILISIIGPSDIRKRSSGAIRIADQILSLDSFLISDLFTDNNNQQEQPQGNANESWHKKSENETPSNQLNNQQPHKLIGTRQFLDNYLETVAAKDSPHLVLGLLRQTAKIMALTGDWVQVQIIHLPNDAEGLGFGIVGGHSTGVVIKSIIAGSVADKDQRLRPGDRILQIGQISTQGLNSQQIAALLRQQDGPIVQLTVGRPIQLQDTEMDTPICWTMATRAALEPSALDEQVQKRLELLANTASTSQCCNGIQPNNRHLSPSQQSTSNQQSSQIAIMNEGTEFPDQLGSHRFSYHTTEEADNDNNITGAIEIDQNRPSTSTGEYTALERETTTGMGRTDRHQKKTADKSHSNPLEEAEKRGNGTNGNGTKRKTRTSRGPSNDNPASCSSSTSAEKRSLRQLQEMALTSFCSDKWPSGKYKTIEVELERDPKIGLGITVAGYVYRKEEINGVFIKSLVPQSSAHLSRQIQLHDLIIEVNGRSLERLSHSESVRTLIRSGQEVKLKLVRFEEDTPQAKCLKMLHEQELAAAAAQQQQGGDSASTSTAGRPQLNNNTSASPIPPALSQHQRKQSLVDYKSYWSNRVGSEYDIVIVDVKPDERIEQDGGLGIEWQGTVDICNGSQLCSHHFIESLRKNGPAARSGLLKAGDELLQVNEISLFGESFMKVRKVLSHIRKENDVDFVRLYFCRKSEHERLNFFMPSPEQTLPMAYSLLASMMAADEHFFKAKSELRLCDIGEDNKKCDLPQKLITSRLKSHSLENLSGFAIWNCVPIIVNLTKDIKGLGFSIADYQDPLHPEEQQVIVIRSLVPGGAAQADGRIVPGDRLLFVNGEDLSNSTLERAIEVLKAAPMGKIVRLGIAKPVPIEQCRLSSTTPLISKSERLLAKSHSPLGRRRRQNDHLLLATAQNNLLNGRDNIDTYCSSAASSQEEIWIGRHSLQTTLNPQLYFPSSIDTASTPISPKSPFSAHRSPSPLMQTTGASASVSAAWTPCSSRSLSPCASPAANSLKGSWSYDIVFLPAHLERHIKVLKGSLPLGVVLNADMDKSINGCVAKNICSKKAIARDGRIQPGDYIVKINGESLRNVTNSQARAIMKRANLVGAQCNISYITASDAKLWNDRLKMDHQYGPFNMEMGSTTAMVMEQQSRLSPKVYPKFYRSPLLDRQQQTKGESEAKSMTMTFVSGDTSSSLMELEHQKMLEKSNTDGVKQPFVNDEKLAAWTEKIMKDLFSEVFFELFIIWKKQQQANNRTDWSWGKLAIPSEGEQQQRSQRSASIAAVAEQVPSSKSESGIGSILRRASSSLKKKRSEKLERQNDIKTAVMADEQNKLATTSSTAEKMSVEEEVEKHQQQSKTMNFWSEPRHVILNRNPNETFGISIVGGRVEVSQKGIDEAAIKPAGTTGSSTTTTAQISSTVAGIFIKSVVTDSAAGRCGQLFMGDRLLSVNDVDLTNTTHEHAVQVIKNAQNPVSFVVQSLQTIQTFVPPSTGGNKRPSQASIFAGKNGDQRRLSTISTGLVEIDADSAAALEKSVDDPESEDAFRYTERKVLQKYEDLPGAPVLIRMANIPPGGLGLILSTKRDEEGENRPPVIVVGVKSDSPLSLKIGDELLEINGRVLFGLSHKEATEKIRHCCEQNGLSLLVLRKQQEQPQTSNESIIDSPQDSLPRERKRTSESECEAGARKIVADVLEKQQQQRLIKEPEELDQQQKENNNEIRPHDREQAKLSSETLKSASSAPAAIINTLQTVNSTGTGGYASAGGNEQNPRKRSWQMEQQHQFLQKCPIQLGQETLIEIDKDGKGLGLSIVGGSDTVLGTVVIHEVYPDGAAAIDGRLKPGDQVLEVNNISLRNITHEQAIQMLRRTPAKVRLLVYRDQNLQMSLLDPTQIYNILTVELVKKMGKGLGISIVGRKNEPGVYVSEIVKGGMADTDGRLMQGDQILAVNEEDVANCMQEDVATILKTCTGKVVLKVGRWKLTETAQRVRSAQPPNLSGGNHSNPNNNNSNNAIQQQQSNNNNNVAANQMPLQQQQNINESSATPSSTTAHGPLTTTTTNGNSSSHPTNGTREPPPPAPLPSSGVKLPPPTLQITLHDENNQQQCLMGAVRTDLSPVSEEDLKSIAETVASEETASAVTTSSSSQRRPLNQLPNTSTTNAITSSSPISSSSSTAASQNQSNSPGGNNTAVPSATLRSDLKEAGCESLLIVLKKEDGQQWGMGIGKRPRGILITSLQPGSSAAEKLTIGDRIMAVNGHEVTTQHSAVTYIRSSGNSVALQISRPMKPFISSSSS